MKDVQTQGIILYNKDYKEKDKLVKIFTANYGKQMIYVKGANTNRYKEKLAIQSMTISDFSLKINESGLSFIKSYSETKFFKRIQTDIFLNAYATYLINLVDVSIADRVVDQALYFFLLQSLALIDKDGMDAEVIVFIFEVQILSRFGVYIDFEHCEICGKNQPPFDFTWDYQGVICQEHLSQSKEIAHVDPNIIHLLSLFSKVNLEKINEIRINQEMKNKIRIFLDLIYNEYVGVNLKSKRFIDNMGKWLK